MISVYPIPIYNNNYIWVISKGNTCAVVDPGHATPVIHHLQSTQQRLEGILVTHKHWDHISGIQALQDYSLQAQGAPLPVYGPAHWAANQVTHLQKGNDCFFLVGLPIQVLDLSGHTIEHIGFHVPQLNAVFSGDTLFSAGCGRIFDGSIERLFASIKKLCTLPDTTRIFASHEYTLDNLRFALAVEPQNSDMVQYQDKCRGLQKQGQPTLPTTLQHEKRVNPFLRCAQPAVIQAAAQWAGKPLDSPLQVFAVLRKWKDVF